jgi:hypothetical protein
VTAGRYHHPFKKITGVQKKPVMVPLSLQLPAETQREFNRDLYTCSKADSADRKTCGKCEMNKQVAGFTFAFNQFISAKQPCL